MVTVEIQDCNPFLTVGADDRRWEPEQLAHELP
jgi:hypothetical protein